MSFNFRGANDLNSFAGECAEGTDVGILATDFSAFAFPGGGKGAGSGCDLRVRLACAEEEDTADLIRGAISLSTRLSGLVSRNWQHHGKSSQTY